MAKNPKIDMRITHDALSLAAKWQTGASLRFSITRSGERLTVAFSNDKAILAAQTKRLVAWIRRRPGETNEARILRMRDLCEGTVSGAAVMNRLDQTIM